MAKQRYSRTASALVFGLFMSVVRTQAYAADTSAPTVPGSPAVSAVTSSGFTFSWTASTDNVGVTGYEIWRGNVATEVSAATTSYTFSGLNGGTAFNVVVRARDAAGNFSALTSPISVVTSVSVDTQAPTVPGVPTVSGLSNTGFTASWKASTDNVAVTGYQLWFGNTAVTLGANATSYAFSGLPAETKNLSVRARDGAGNWSALTAPVAVTIAGGDITPPTTPTGFAASNLSSSGFSVAWTASSDNVAVTGYQLWLGNSATNLPAGTTSYNFTGLNAGSYTVAVRARDAAGNWSPLATLKATVPAVVVGPSVPTALTSSNITATGFTLGWTASTDTLPISGYQVSLNGATPTVVTGTSTSFTGLSASQSYTVTVAAVDSANNVSTPASLQVQTIADPTLATVYYYNSSNWTTVNIHYGISGTWTTPPGVPMTLACTGYWTKAVSLGTATTFAVDFNNGSTWDNNGGSNYALGTGLTIVKNGVVTANAASPCVIDKTPPTPPSNLVGTANGTVVSLGWTASTDNSGTIAHYTITRTGGAGSTTFTSTSPNYTDTSGAPNTGYTYSVTASDPSGNVSTSSASVSVITGAQSVVTQSFSWRNATVYFAMTDRFVNGDTSNDRSYCRESDQNCVPFSNNLTQGQATFHGGDLKGLKSKVDAGYFSDLGVNAIWISAPYEQIHGWVTGDGQKHYAYHGYYVLDYTNIDQNFGTAADLQALVDSAHAKGIRVVVDIVMNHPGYETMYDMNEYGFGTLNSGWQTHAFKTDFAADYNTDVGPYVDTTNASAWANWWTGAWIRDPKAGYPACGSDDLTICVGSLPDFITEGSATVSLPQILVTKWTKEGRLAAQQASLDAWFTKTGYPRTVRYYEVKWLTDLVRTYGVDGFRCDTAKNVEQGSWAALKTEAVKARNDWLAANPTKAAQLVGDTGFWMTGEVYGHGVNRDSYFDNGFDSLINFNFMGAASNLSGIDSTYQSLDQVNKDGTWDMLSYISSHDIGLFDRNNLVTGLSALFMAPGGIEIFYGDETARPLMTSWGGTHAYRGDMNWSSINTTVYNHAKIMGSFRNKHVAVGGGIHTQISSSPYTFERQQGSDTVVVAFGVSGTASISVGSAWANGTALRDYYTGATTTVTNGTATVTAGSAGVVLLEAAQ